MSLKVSESNEGRNQGDITTLGIHPRSHKEVEKALSIIDAATAGIELIWKPRAHAAQDYKTLALLETELIGLHIAAKAIKWTLCLEPALFDFGKVAQYHIPGDGG